MNVSEREVTGISNGKPPACQTPRLISSARWRKWVWQVFIAPGIEDADDRLSFPVFLGKAQLLEARAMGEGAQVVGADPSIAAEFVGLLTNFCVMWHGDFGVPLRIRPALLSEQAASSAICEAPQQGLVENNGGRGLYF